MATPASLGTASTITAAHSLTKTGLTASVGDWILVQGFMRANNSADTIVVTDSAGNTWPVSTQTGASNAATANQLFSCLVQLTVALVAGSITVADTTTGATQFSRCGFDVIKTTNASTIGEDTGVRATKGAVASAAPSLTSGTTANNGVTHIGVYGSLGSNAGTCTEDAAWTALNTAVGNSGTPFTFSTAYIVNAGSGTKTRTLTTTSQAYGMIVVGFQAASAGPTYTLAIGQMSVSVTAQAIGLKASRLLTIAQMSVAVTTQAMALKASRLLSIANATVSVAAQAIGLRASRILSIAQASVSVTTQAIGLKASRKISITPMTVSIAAQSISLRASRILAIGMASVSVALQAISLSKTRAFIIGTLSVVISAQAINLKASRVLSIGTTTVSVATQAIGLLRQRVLAIGTMSVAVAMQSVALKAARRLTISLMAVSVALQAIALTKHIAGQFGRTPRYAFRAGARVLTVVANSRNRGTVAAARNRTEPPSDSPTTLLESTLDYFILFF